MNFTQLTFRKATETDLPKIVAMLADDILGQSRENPDKISNYHQAFLEISQSNNNFLAVVEFENEVIATCHLTLIPSLPLQGAKRMNIEAVRVDNKFTNLGIGSWMMQQALNFAKKNNVKIIQLTSNNSRRDAHRFYEKLGFKATHLGMKLFL